MKRIYLHIALLLVCSSGLYAQQSTTGGNQINITDNSPLRVTGGSQINITDAPWQVILKDGNNYTCGGSIVAPNLILTAKHCTDDVTASNLKVVAGITCKSEAGTGNTFSVSEIIQHPTLDVALLRLSTNITYNTSRNEINYRSSSNSALYDTGTEVSVSGWGVLTPNGYVGSSCLNAVNLHIISNQDAAAALDSVVTVDEVACTGIGTVRQGACSGDSGGPLVTWSDALNEYVLIGVVSWGRVSCGGTNANSPSIFVRVSSIVDWIDSHRTYTISGPDYISSYSSATYTIENKPSNATVTWSSVGISLADANNTTNSSAVFNYTHSSSNYLYSTYGTPIDYRNARIQATLNFSNGQSLTLPVKNIKEPDLSMGLYTQEGIPSATNRLLAWENPYVPYTAEEYHTVTINLFSSPNITHSWTVTNLTGLHVPNPALNNTSNRGTVLSFFPHGDRYEFTVSATFFGTTYSHTHTFNPYVNSSGGVECMSSYYPDTQTVGISFINTQSLPPSAYYTVLLYDLNGRKIRETRSSGEAVAWNLSSERNGIYLVVVRDSNNQKVYSNIIRK